MWHRMKIKWMPAMFGYGSLNFISRSFFGQTNKFIFYCRWTSNIAEEAWSKVTLVWSTTHNKKSKTFALKFDKSMFCATFSGHTEYIKYFYSWLSFLPLAVKGRCWNFQWAPNFILSYLVVGVWHLKEKIWWWRIFSTHFSYAVRLRILCDFSS